MVRRIGDFGSPMNDASPEKESKTQSSLSSKTMYCNSRDIYFFHGNRDRKVQLQYTHCDIYIKGMPYY